MAEFTTFTVSSSGELYIKRVDGYATPTVYINGSQVSLPYNSFGEQLSVKIKGNFSLYRSDCTISNFVLQSDLTSIKQMFSWYGGRTLDLSGMYITNVTNMEEVLYHCYAEEIYIQNWDTRKIDRDNGHRNALNGVNTRCKIYVDPTKFIRPSLNTVWKPDALSWDPDEANGGGFVYIEGGGEPIDPSPDGYKITYVLTNCTCDAGVTSVNVTKNSNYEDTLRANSGYITLTTITRDGTTVELSGKSSTRNIKLTNITSDVTITATAINVDKTYNIIYDLTNCTSSNTVTKVNEGADYKTTITANENCIIETAIITKNDIQTYLDGKSDLREIKISNITSDIIIKVTACYENGSTTPPGSGGGGGSDPGDGGGGGGTITPINPTPGGGGGGGGSSDPNNPIGNRDYIIIYYILNNCTSSNNYTMLPKGSDYSAIVTAWDGYLISDVIIGVNNTTFTDRVKYSKKYNIDVKDVVTDMTIVVTAEKGDDY